MATFRPGQVLTDARLNADEIVGQCVFAAGRSTAQTLATATQTAISLDTPTIDTLGSYSAGTPTRFTPTIAGDYLFTGLIGFVGNGTGSRIGYWSKNGSTFTYVRFAAASVDIVIPMPGVVIAMNGTTDYVTLDGRQDSGGNLNTTDTAGQPRMIVTYVGTS